MWPQLFLWRTIIDRCWPGVLRPSTRKNLRTKGAVSSKSTKKTQFEENLCYLAFSKTVELQKERPLWGRTPKGRFQTTFLTAMAKTAA